jgi:hypothetical protein
VNAPSCRLSAVRSLLPGFIALLVLSACTTPKVDWNAQIGIYTYDQAVIDLGPPDKSATLSDGTRVVEWLTQRGYHGGYVGVYGGFYAPYRPYSYYPAMPYAYESSWPDYFLRLTFDPDGKLRAWKKLTR